jgi:hypothetical protein
MLMDYVGKITQWHINPLIAIGSIVGIPIIGSIIVGGTIIIVVIIPLRAIIGKMIRLVTDETSSSPIIRKVPGIVGIIIIGVVIGWIPSSTISC